MGDWSAFRARLERRYDNAAEAAKDDLVRNLRQAAPVGTGEGRTHGQVRAAVAGHVEGGTTGRYRIVVEDPEPAALFTDAGTRPHDIYPRRARALRFSAGGVTVFAAHVRSPGNGATHWFRNEVTAERVTSVLRSVLARL